LLHIRLPVYRLFDLCSNDPGLNIEAAQNQNKQAQIILAFLSRFDATQPVTKDQDHHTSKGGKSQVQCAQWKEHPSAPDTDQMTQSEPQDAQAKIQQQSPEAPIPYQMIDRAIEEGNQEGKEEGWKRHRQLLTVDMITRHDLAQYVTTPANFFCKTCTAY
jgi:hypothetical protein